ncbi:MAG: hypothetical protein ABIR47_18310 [Candidatus Kapaibacterium sp.]
MSRKQDIYCEMLNTSLSVIRNISTWRWWRRIRNRTTYLEAQLIHNISHSILDEKIVQHDIWFLNYQARSYLERATPENSINYYRMKCCIRQLFDIAISEGVEGLKWDGPEWTAADQARYPYYGQT